MNSKSVIDSQLKFLTEISREISPHFFRQLTVVIIMKQWNFLMSFILNRSRKSYGFSCLDYKRSDFGSLFRRTQSGSSEQLATLNILVQYCQGLS